MMKIVFIVAILLTVKMTVQEGQNCNGKPFYCTSQTHFLICVDLGNGISTTVDNNAIMCPPGTFCLEGNTFECELKVFSPLPITSVTENTKITNPNENAMFYNLSTPIPYTKEKYEKIGPESKQNYQVNQSESTTSDIGIWKSPKKSNVTKKSINNVQTSTQSSNQPDTTVIVENATTEAVKISTIPHFLTTPKQIVYEKHNLVSENELIDSENQIFDNINHSTSTNSQIGARERITKSNVTNKSTNDPQTSTQSSNEPETTAVVKNTKIDNISIIDNFSTTPKENTNETHSEYELIGSENTDIYQGNQSKSNSSHIRVTISLTKSNVTNESTNNVQASTQFSNEPEKIVLIENTNITNANVRINDQSSTIPKQNINETHSEYELMSLENNEIVKLNQSMPNNFDVISIVERLNESNVTNNSTNNVQTSRQSSNEPETTLLAENRKNSTVNIRVFDRVNESNVIIISKENTNVTHSEYELIGSEYIQTRQVNQSQLNNTRIRITNGLSISNVTNESTNNIQTSTQSSNKSEKTVIVENNDISNVDISVTAQASVKPKENTNKILSEYELMSSKNKEIVERNQSMSNNSDISVMEILNESNVTKNSTNNVQSSRKSLNEPETIVLVENTKIRTTNVSIFDQLNEYNVTNNSTNMLPSSTQFSNISETNAIVENVQIYNVSIIDNLSTIPRQNTNDTYSENKDIDQENQSQSNNSHISITDGFTKSNLTNDNTNNVQTSTHTSNEHEKTVVADNTNITNANISIIDKSFMTPELKHSEHERIHSEKKEIGKINQVTSINFDIGVKESLNISNVTNENTNSVQKLTQSLNLPKTAIVVENKTTSNKRNDYDTYNLGSEYEFLVSENQETDHINQSTSINSQIGVTESLEKLTVINTSSINVHISTQSSKKPDTAVARENYKVAMANISIIDHFSTTPNQNSNITYSGNELIRLERNEINQENQSTSFKSDNGVTNRLNKSNLTIENTNNVQTPTQYSNGPETTVVVKNTNITIDNISIIDHISATPKLNANEKDPKYKLIDTENKEINQVNESVSFNSDIDVTDSLNKSKVRNKDDNNTSTYILVNNSIDISRNTSNQSSSNFNRNINSSSTWKNDLIAITSSFITTNTPSIIINGLLKEEIQNINESTLITNEIKETTHNSIATTANNNKTNNVSLILLSNEIAVKIYDIDTMHPDNFHRLRNVTKHNTLNEDPNKFVSSVKRSTNPIDNSHKIFFREKIHEIENDGNDYKKIIHNKTDIAMYDKNTLLNVSQNSLLNYSTPLNNASNSIKNQSILTLLNEYKNNTITTTVSTEPIITFNDNLFTNSFEANKKSFGNAYESVKENISKNDNDNKISSSTVDNQIKINKYSEFQPDDTGIKEYDHTKKSTNFYEINYSTSEIVGIPNTPIESLEYVSATNNYKNIPYFEKPGPKIIKGNSNYINSTSITLNTSKATSNNNINVLTSSIDKINNLKIKNTIIKELHVITNESELVKNTSEEAMVNRQNESLTTIADIDIAKKYKRTNTLTTSELKTNTYKEAKNVSTSKQADVKDTPSASSYLFAGGTTVSISRNTNTLGDIQDNSNSFVENLNDINKTHSSSNITGTILISDDIILVNFTTSQLLLNEENINGKPTENITTEIIANSYKETLKSFNDLFSDNMTYKIYNDNRTSYHDNSLIITNLSKQSSNISTNVNLSNDISNIKLAVLPSISLKINNTNKFTEMDTTQVNDESEFIIEVFEENVQILRRPTVEENQNELRNSILNKTINTRYGNNPIYLNNIIINFTGESSNKINLSVSSTRGIYDRELCPIVNIDRRVANILYNTYTHVSSSQIESHLKTKDININICDIMFTFSEHNREENEFTCEGKNIGAFPYAMNPQQFYICVGITKPVIGTCPLHTQYLSLDNTCGTINSPFEEYHCVKEGRFKDKVSNNTYFICAINLTGNLIRYKLTCKAGYYVSNFIKCVILENGTASSNDHNRTINEHIPMNDIFNKEYDTCSQFTCRKNGRFKDECSINSFYVCQLKTSGLFLRYKVKCKDGFKLNITSLNCINNKHFQYDIHNVGEHTDKKTKLIEKNNILNFLPRNLDEKDSVEDSHENNRHSYNVNENFRKKQNIELNSKLLSSEEVSSAENIHKHIRKRSKPWTKEEFKCVTEGKFENPANLRKYYVCRRRSGKLKKYKKKCKKGFIFSNKSKTCTRVSNNKSH